MALLLPPKRGKKLKCSHRSALHSSTPADAHSGGCLRVGRATAPAPSAQERLPPSGTHRPMCADGLDVLIDPFGAPGLAIGGRR